MKIIIIFREILSDNTSQNNLTLVHLSIFILYIGTNNTTEKENKSTLNYKGDIYV